MAYNNGFPMNYQPAQMYYPQQYQQSAPAQQHNSIIWVQGEAGAKSYLVAPNTTVQLWDSENQVIYLKSADASGMPSIKTLDYTIRETKPAQPVNAGISVDPSSMYATKEDLEALRAEMETMLSNKRMPIKPKKEVEE